jgi:hypothetical protein
LDVDIMLEAKAKEKAIQQYVNANKIKLEL